MVQLLLQHVAKVTLSDDPAWSTPIAMATYRGHHEIALLLTNV